MSRSSAGTRDRPATRSLFGEWLAAEGWRLDASVPTRLAAVAVVLELAFLRNDGLTAHRSEDSLPGRADRRRLAHSLAGVRLLRPVAAALGRRLLAQADRAFALIERCIGSRMGAERIETGAARRVSRLSRATRRPGCARCHAPPAAWPARLGCRSRARGGSAPASRSRSSARSGCRAGWRGSRAPVRACHPGHRLVRQHRVETCGAARNVSQRRRA